MKINESSIDSVIRVFTGFFLLYLGFSASLEGILAVGAVILGAGILLTGVIGYCPIYSIFHFNGRKQ
jgi:hypothetical protein